MLLQLNEAEVEYLLVGAYAVAVHAVSRATDDIDFWVRPSNENAPKVIQALFAFGAPLMGLTEEDLIKPGLVFQIGVKPQCVHLMNSVSGVTFDEAWTNRVIVEIDGIPTPVIGINELIENKLASGRRKDLIDVEWLKEKRGDIAPDKS